MKYRQLGRSSITLSAIGFGCMSLPSDETMVGQLLHRAVSHGVNFFDTADLYQHGENERIVGKALKPFRKQVILATKVGNQWRSDGSGWDWSPNKQYILSAIDQSLERLQTDYVDLYQLHGGTIEDPIDEIIEAFELLREKGKILHYGISSIRPNVIREFAARASIDSVMMQYSLLDRRAEESCMPLLSERQISVLARGSIGKGLLAGKKPAAFLNHSEQDITKLTEVLKDHQSDAIASAQLAIRWVLHNPVICSAIIGVRTLEQLEDAVKTSDFPPLSREEYQALSGILSAGRYEEHR